ncbi:hypothetical protein FOMPIDRAFT_1059740 [Fomitopsis schrenkii]|uniref:N-acetyltransferase domain-containing protein n=1 Tax=Fomitopsis schrenkii TaxID=2126942 RepID=S8EA85_FOMSC|nr:hypothetical protein FOMPIDRAFT_1059740 [Fomitopsis schrenkii]
MSRSPLHPLQVNPSTGEPYLRLPSPHTNIIITPPRMSDVDALVGHMNDARVVSSFSGPAYPYLTSHAESWISTVKEKSDGLLAELKQQHPDAPLKLVGGCPVHYIREVADDGTETFIGDLFIHRCHFPHDGAQQTALRAEENAARPVGDPAIVWCVGDWLASSHHGRGIMSAVFRILMTEWAIPRMNVQTMRVEVYADNAASSRVFEKFGFKEERITDKVVTTNSGVVWHGVRLLWWKLSES